MIDFLWMYWWEQECVEALDFEPVYAGFGAYARDEIEGVNCGRFLQ